jgi:GntR family transcriptional regulator
MALVRNRPLLPDVVRSELRRAIIGGEFPAGSKLPNEEALCTRFSVSRITLREAVRGLIEDGYVVRRQGAGTFVTSGPALRNSLDTNFSYTEYLESSGIKVSKKVLDARLVSGDDDVAADLDLGADDSFVVIRRVRIAGKRPAIYSMPGATSRLSAARSTSCSRREGTMSTTPAPSSRRCWRPARSPRSLMCRRVRRCSI